MLVTIACLVTIIVVLDSIRSSRVQFPATSKSYGGLTELAAVLSIQPRNARLYEFEFNFREEEFWRGFPVVVPLDHTYSTQPGKPW